MKEIVTVYFQHVEKLRVAAALPLTATNSGGPVGTLQSKALPAGLSSTCLTTCGSLRLVCTATTLSSRVTCGASWRTFLQASSLQTEARRTSPWRPITHVAGKPINQGARVPRFKRLMSGQAPSPSCASSDALLSPDAHTLQLGPHNRPLHYVDYSVTPSVGCSLTSTGLQPNLPSLTQ